MKRKFEGLITFLKINTVVGLVVGLIVFIFGLDSLTRGAPEEYLLLGAGIGLLSGAIWVFVAAAILELLSDVEFSTRKPELVELKPEVLNPDPYGHNPFNRPHAFCVRRTQSAEADCNRSTSATIRSGFSDGTTRRACQRNMRGKVNTSDCRG